MSLRRAVRKAIQSGTAIHATVEEYHLGYATVRLATNGARLTNLSTQGAIVKRDDEVIVDYSSGVKPVVRPLFIPEYIPPELEIDEGREVMYMDDDWSCDVHATINIGYGRAPDGSSAYPAYSGITCWAFNGVPTKVWWADNYMWLGSFKYGGSVEDYDIAEGPEGMYNENDSYGSDHIEIKRTGRYLITGRMEWDAVGNSTKSYAEFDPTGGWNGLIGEWNNLTGTPEDPEYNPTGLTGHFWIGISKNDVIVAKVSNRTYEDEGFTYGGVDVYMQVNAITWCNYGDKISLVVYQTIVDGPTFPGWGFPASGVTDSNGLQVVYIPGSERAIYQASSSQSAYIFGHSLQQSAYLCGTIDGDNYKTPAYLKGGVTAGYLGEYPTPDAVVKAYLEGTT